MEKIDDWKPEVGMEVFVVLTWGRRKPFVERISKVDKKYFYTGKFQQTKYSIETKDEENGQCSSQSHCYRCEADYNRVIELQNKRRDIERSLHKLTEDQVDQVYEWITTNTEEL